MKPAHPDDCLCGVCAPGRVLAATGGWEWVDDGRGDVAVEAETDDVSIRAGEWIVLDLAVLALALAIAWATLSGGQ